MRRERVGQLEALVVAALPKALARERNRYERPAFLEHIHRPADASHAPREIRRRSVPPAVLERVHDAEPSEPGCPSRASRRADVRRQQRTPTAALAVCGMTAALTARLGQERKPRP